MSSAVLTSVAPARTGQSPGKLPYGKALGFSLALIVATTLLYLPIVHDPFTNIDDQGYVYENLKVQDGLTWRTAKWAATTFDDNNWHPLAWMSHALDCQLFGIDPAGHHAMAIAYHSLDVLVLFWVLLFATGYLGRSLMVAALFALHPINVEAVAWAAERKTLVSTLFFLLALGAYRWYARQPGVLRYAAVAALFALAVMGKPQVITLPAVLLLWDYWPLRRMFANQPGASTSDDPLPALPPRSLWWLIKEKMPLLVICAGSALATLKAQHAGHPQSWPYSAWVRLGNCIVAYVRYIGKALWPSKLAIMYLHPGNSLRVWQAALCGLLLLSITGLVLLGRRHRYLPVGWFWFLGTMVPTIGIVQVGRQAMADRYAYQSFLGLFILICWGISELARSRQLPKALLPGAAIVWLLILSFLTHRQIGYWKDNLILWQHTAQVTQNNWMAEELIGGILLAQGHKEEAIAHYRAAGDLNPSEPAPNLFIAIYEQGRGNLPEAVERYKKAIRAMDDPLEQAKALQNLAVAYRDLGDIQQSVDCLKRAQRLRKAARADHF